MTKQEIKCSHCKQWTIWKGELYDRCQICGELLELEKIERIRQQQEKKKAAEEQERIRVAQQHPFFRRVFNYASTLFIGFILLIIAVIVLMAG